LQNGWFGSTKANQDFDQTLTREPVTKNEREFETLNPFGNTRQKPRYRTSIFQIIVNTEKEEKETKEHENHLQSTSTK
jgi:hypothetical protein